jgi:hypothetical protein
MTLSTALLRLRDLRPGRCGIIATALLLPIAVAGPGVAQELIPFTPSSSAGTLYIGNATGPASDEGGVSVDLRLSEPFLDGRGDRGAGFGDWGSDSSMLTGGAIVDVYPFRSGLRLSGGLRFGGSAESAGAFTVRGDSYPAMLVTAPDGVGVDGPTPYVGVGYGTTLFDGTIDLSIDAGALTAVPGSDGLSVNERAGSADPEVGNFLPMVGVSATYRF